MAFQFIGKHFRGDYSLGRSYWVHTFPVSLVAPALGLLLLPWLGENFPSRYASAAALGLTALGLVLWIWAIAGTWAAANKHVSRGGRAGWASAAKVAIVLGVLRTASELSSNGSSFAEHVQVALGKQPGSEAVLQIRADGRSILVSGGINDGTAEQLVRALELAPQVDTVVLQSSGGWVRQGKLMAEVVKSRGLNTYVEGECSSACTIAFLAGKERAIAPGARLGFHSFRSVGGGGSKQVLVSTYRQAGLSEAFITRASEVPSAEMWYPSTEELLASGTVTRQSRGGETAALATEVRTKEALDAGFRGASLFAALAQKYPEDYATILNAAWDGVSARKTDAEIIADARSKLFAITRRLIPMASDEVLFRLNKVMQAEAESLSGGHAAACVELTFSPSGTSNVAPLLPPGLVQRELDVLSDVIRSADRSNMRKVDAADVNKAMIQALRGLSDQHLKIIGAGNATEFPAATACQAGIAFYAALNAAPEPTRKLLLRAIYSAL